MLRSGVYQVVVTVEPPKGIEGLTRHDEASLSQHMAAETGGWRRTASRSVIVLEKYQSNSFSRLDARPTAFWADVP